jgi:hypothetical protein
MGPLPAVLLCFLGTVLPRTALYCPGSAAGSCNQHPQSWDDAPLVFFLPKTSDTTITELYIENTVRRTVFATAVVPLDDMKMLGGKGGEAHPPHLASCTVLTDWDPDWVLVGLFRLTSATSVCCCNGSCC